MKTKAQDSSDRTRPQIEAHMPVVKVIVSQHSTCLLLGLLSITLDLPLPAGCAVNEDGVTLSQGPFGA